mmetsp:Transcript_31531/g.52979  ORF Transcript_31531/g.52979 Transcript_31531/m.52979 type:complete len:315 (+) Transcript_31531:253-1197(+)
MFSSQSIQRIALVRTDARELRLNKVVVSRRPMKAQPPRMRSQPTAAINDHSERPRGVARRELLSTAAGFSAAAFLSLVAPMTAQAEESASGLSTPAEVVSLSVADVPTGAGPYLAQSGAAESKCEDTSALANEIATLKQENKQVATLKQENKQIETLKQENKQIEVLKRENKELVDGLNKQMETSNKQVEALKKENNELNVALAKERAALKEARSVPKERMDKLEKDLAMAKSALQEVNDDYILKIGQLKAKLQARENSAATGDQLVTRNKVLEDALAERKTLVGKLTADNNRLKDKVVKLEGSLEKTLSILSR